MFFGSIVYTQAVFQTTFDGPSNTVAPATPSSGIGGQFLTNTTTEEYITPTSGVGSGPVLGRTLNLNIDSSGLYSLVTDGIYSFGPVRAIGKLTATLLPTNLTGYNAREVMSIKGGSASGLISFLTNVDYVGFFSQSNFVPPVPPSGGVGLPSFDDPLSTLKSSKKSITNLRFGRVNVTKTVVSPYDPYAIVTKDLTLYGTTNLGRGDICYMPVPSPDANIDPNTQASAAFRCPQGYFIKGPGKTTYHWSQPNTPMFVCQSVNPVTIPGSNSTGSMNHDFNLCPN